MSTARLLKQGVFIVLALFLLTGTAAACGGAEFDWRLNETTDGEPEGTSDVQPVSETLDPCSGPAYDAWAINTGFITGWSSDGGVHILPSPAGFAETFDSANACTGY